MTHRLSFGYITILTDQIAEVIVDQGVEMTLEMVEEYDDFLLRHFKNDFGLLINKLHQYSYTYEAQLCIAALEGIKAMAVITYDRTGKDRTSQLLETHENDGWNLCQFSGLELGRFAALAWLEQQLVTA